MCSVESVSIRAEPARGPETLTARSQAEPTYVRAVSGGAKAPVTCGNVRDSGASLSGEDRVGRPMPPHLLPRPYRTLCSNSGERMATSWQPSPAATVTAATPRVTGRVLRRVSSAAGPPVDMRDELFSTA